MAKFDSNLSQVVDLDQGGSSAYSPLNPAAPSTAASKAVSWTMQWKDNSSTENVVPPNYSYHHTQQPVPLVRDVQDGEKAAKQSVTSSSLGSTHGSQEQAGLSSYSSPTDAYGYDNTGYQGYYYGYQQQASNAYSQQVGTYQNSGAPYQPLTSFQNSGTYSGSTSYSSTYYNTADYQTSGGYPSTSSSNQTTQWSDGNYASYPSHQYPNYTTLDSNAAHSSTSVASAPLSYEQQYKQWADYYSHTASASDVTCAPGTENVSATSASSQNTQIPGVSGAYPLSDSQPPPPGTTSWRQEPSSSDFPPLQACVPTGSGETYNGYWADGTSGYHHSSQTTSFSQAPSYTQIPSYTHTPSYSQTLSYTQATPSYSQIPSYAQTPPYSQTSSHSPAPSYFQKSLDSNPAPHETQDLQKTAFPLGPNSQYSTVQQISQNYHSPMQSVSTFDAHRVKVQIPTNPRIASNLAVGLPKTEKDISTTEAVTKPAYVNVSMAKLDKVSSHDAADSMLKPGAFPASLRAYVERALARCKNDLQKAACQTIMKEIITNASADGTLFTRNWDIEPLFQLPDLDARNKNSSQDASILSSLPKYKKSPGRRTKSRWEPLSEEKLASVNQVSVKDISWDRVKEREKAVSGGRFGNKEDGWSSAKFLQAQLQNQSKTPQRPFKKPRVGDVNSVTENGDASSDSEKEQGLTAYCSGGLALGNSPEERKRRENRSKRFEKGPGQRTEGKPLRPKVVGGGSLYTKRASALALGRDHEDGGSRAVEDIDWDSLTVKGTCQEIEKRYLRLTSAPDPATVRPEEVLEKALNMVLSSKKNYLYKCDQLKSLRQDLTVQRIRNELTVKVYETHARLALEAGDLPEYNQCQSQLKILYAEGIKGCHMEFSAYNLLCVILHSNNSRDLVASMARLSGEAKNDEAVKHALAVRAAVTSGNYVSFFRLYRTAPNLNTCLMDLHVERMRFEAVKCMSRSYRPAVPIAFIAQVLGFMGPTSTTEGYDEKDKDALEECGEWLKAHGASLTVDSSGDAQLDTKASSSSLFMPEPEDAVAHGDANLAVNDFFTRTA